VSQVLVVGDLVDDISVRVLDDVTEASDTNAEIRLRPGGSAGNVAAWLGRLGTDAVFCGRVGADAVERHTRALVDHGVRPYLTGDPDRTTATIVLQLDREGERTMFVDRGANSGLVISDVPEEAWEGVTWLHLTGYTFFDPSTRPVAASLVAEARRRDARVSVDPSSVAFLRAAGAEEFLGWIDGADVIFPNFDEARALVGATGPHVDLDLLAERFAHVAVTLGPMGSAYLSGAGPSGIRTQVTAPRVDVVDTTGAGDAFAAGFLARWIEGATPEGALDGGRAAAETCVAHLGARPVVRV
jgi:sugar/nucleoside kinase (ribokinase family)